MPAAHSSGGTLSTSMSAGTLSGWSQISVAIGPGSTSFTSTPVPARSSSIASANPHIAYFAALYADSFAIGMRPPMLDTNTICPLPRSIMRGNTASAMRTGEWKSTSITCCTSSGVRSVTRVRFGIAALFTSTSRPPNASHASSATCSARARSPRSAAHICESAVCLRHCASTSSSRSARRGDDADGRAALGEDRRERRADARRRAGHEDLGAVELHCDFSSDSCCAQLKMPFDIVDASRRARAPKISARTACTPLSSGAACAASSAR